MKDPLAGRRDEINDGTAISLVWLDSGRGCPVKKGEIFKLRACSIEITVIQRFQKKLDWNYNDQPMPAGWYWRAEFTTYRLLTRQRFLAKRGGTTTDRKQAMAVQDDPDPATLAVIAEDERDPVAATQHASLGEAPEAAVPHHEVPSYEASVEAAQLYALAHGERRVVEAEAPLEERLASLREASRTRNVDITSDLFIIEQRIERAERKVLDGAAA
jgi:hypothetical protein